MIWWILRFLHEVDHAGPFEFDGIVFSNFRQKIGMLNRNEALRALFLIPEIQKRAVICTHVTFITEDEGKIAVDPSAQGSNVGCEAASRPVCRVDPTFWIFLFQPLHFFDHLL